MTAGVWLSFLLGLVCVISASLLEEESYLRVALGWFGYGLIAGSFLYFLFR